MLSMASHGMVYPEGGDKDNNIINLKVQGVKGRKTQQLQTGLQ